MSIYICVDTCCMCINSPQGLHLPATVSLYVYVCVYIYNVNQMYSDQKGKTFRGGPSELCDVTIQNRHSLAVSILCP